MTPRLAGARIAVRPSPLSLRPNQLLLNPLLLELLLLELQLLLQLLQLHLLLKLVHLLPPLIDQLLARRLLLRHCPDGQGQREQEQKCKILDHGCISWASVSRSPETTPNMERPSSLCH
jgi:hypothetical protein